MYIGLPIKQNIEMVNNQAELSNKKNCLYTLIVCYVSEQGLTRFNLHILNNKPSAYIFNSVS